MTTSAGLRFVCPFTNGASNEDLDQQVVTLVTSVVYTYQVESFHESVAEISSEIATASQSEISEWITSRTLNGVASELCDPPASQASTTTFSCLSSLTHSAGSVELLPCTSDTCAAVHPNILTLKHNADCTSDLLEHATLLAVQTAMSDPILLRDLRQQFPMVASMRMVLGEEDTNRNKNGSTSEAPLERGITPAGLIMLVVTGIMVLAAIVLLFAWWRDLREQKHPNSRHSRKNNAKRKGHQRKSHLTTTNRKSSKREAIGEPPARTQQSYLVQTKACTTNGQPEVIDPEICYLTEEGFSEALSPREDHRPVLGALPWQHRRFDLYTIDDCTEEDASLSSQSILEELEQLSKEELERRTLRVPSQVGCMSSSSSSSTSRGRWDVEATPPAGLDTKIKTHTVSPPLHPDDESTVVHSSTQQQQVRILYLIARSADEVLDEDADNGSNQAVLTFAEQAPIPSLLSTDDEDECLDSSDDSETSFTVRLPADPGTREAVLRNRDHSLLLPRHAVVKSEDPMKGHGCRITSKNTIPNNITFHPSENEKAVSFSEVMLRGSTKKPGCLKTSGHGGEIGRKKAVSWKWTVVGSSWKEAPAVVL